VARRERTEQQRDANKRHLQFCAASLHLRATAMESKAGIEHDNGVNRCLAFAAVYINQGYTAEDVLAITST
jgi:hypothetical protein